MKAINLLEIGHAKVKRDFIQHIRGELIYVKLDDTVTYNGLFDRIRERFKDHPSNLAAAEEWIAFQDGTPDQYAQPMNQPGHSLENCYAMFHLYDLQDNPSDAVTTK